MTVLCHLRPQFKTKMRSKRRTIYQAGSVKVHLSANGTYAIDGTVLGKRIRKRAKTQNEAEMIANSLAEGSDASIVLRTSLTNEQARDSEAAYSILEQVKDAPSLSELARAHLLESKRRESALIIDAIWKFIEAKEHRSERTRQEIKSRLFKFSKWAGEKALDEISKVDAQKFLQSIPEGSFNHFLRLCKGLYIWAVEQELATANPFAHIKLRSRAHVEVRVLSSEQARALLDAAKSLMDGELLAYASICLFGGLRPDSEMRKLTWDSINLEDCEIRVTEGKTRTPRTVEVPTNLLEWLLICDRSKPIYPANFRRKWAMIRQAAGFKGGAAMTTKQRESEKNLKEWQPDMTRHSAISYKVREARDINTTATWAGNSVSVIRRHYLSLVTSTEAKEYWSIEPVSGLLKQA